MGEMRGTESGKVTDTPRILLTGANGFVGRAVLIEARAQGLRVVAVTRSAAPGKVPQMKGVTWLEADLSDPTCIPLLREAAQGCSAAIHAAAHLGADEGAVSAGTIDGTRHLLEALEGLPLHLVLVSSIAVYDTARLSPGAEVTETTPLDTPTSARDAYVGGKLVQEELCRDSGLPLWILRPGTIFGEGRTWNAHLGPALGPVLIRVGMTGELPLAHVSHVAKRLLQAAQRRPEGPRVVNVIDPDRPDRTRFLRAHAASGWPKLVLPLPWPLWMLAARLLSPFAAGLPGLLRVPALKARMMPLRYPDRGLLAALGPLPQERFGALMARSLREGTE
ncbi:NAD-dependent epimerase/dehydratase family protein [Alloyangia pacifica]|uniref:Nucleoside-diphosphate-sugar epimerase n=1 Tax=Alloyangia pacifica TaxID=311180 RepID=A0A1I6U5I9_9RHOB|nr:NAD(P)-dependent oxidoreductase [Alloyangia pacifica]SDH38698.1 Nucleoside-diphosphate-sugar epimerase [Alloyangia pacifica]SFS96527.1 Nucleoside-diphosphate-sugar epimerase [Alloyangia pacifica]